MNINFSSYESTNKNAFSASFNPEKWVDILKIAHLSVLEGLSKTSEIVLRDADHSVHRLVDDVIVAAPYGSQQKQEAYRKILHRNRIIKVSNRDSARGCS